jgi:AcrR family transcriptional regulator
VKAASRPASKRLPPGSHGIPAEVVARNQRERLIAAMVEVCAERGYAGASVTDVVKRAGVSSVTFYERFAAKPTACRSSRMSWSRRFDRHTR